MKHFFAARIESGLVGLVGVEVLGSDTLLGSLAVVKLFRGAGLGSELLKCAENYARVNGCRSVYLFTITADSFFRAKGYAIVSRLLAPEPILNSSGFLTLCPDTSIFIVKHFSHQGHSCAGGKYILGNGV